LDLDNFHFIQVDFVADGGFLLIIHIAFRKYWWISWISIFRPTGTGVYSALSAITAFTAYVLLRVFYRAKRID